MEPERSPTAVDNDPIATHTFPAYAFWGGRPIFQVQEGEAFLIKDENGPSLDIVLPDSTELTSEPTVYIQCGENLGYARKSDMP